MASRSLESVFYLARRRGPQGGRNITRDIRQGKRHEMHSNETERYRRDTDMTPEQLTAAIERTIGKRGGSEFCRRMQINRATLYRWQAGITPVPNWVPMVMQQFEEKGKGNG